MMRYFFHRVDGGQDFDHEGVELSSVEEARHEAVLFAADTLKDGRYALWHGGEIRIDVTDEAQTIIFTVVISSIFPQGG